MRFLLLFFIIIPLVEMMLLFEVADVIGGLSTIGLVVLTAVIGIQILKQQGLSTLLRAQQRLQTGELPAQEIVEGMMLAGAGALLLTPGFITDTLGFTFLTGPLRRPIARRVIKSGMVKAMGSGSQSGFRTWSSHSQSSQSDTSPHDNVYEGEYSEEGLSQIDQKQTKDGFTEDKTDSNKS